VTLRAASQLAAIQEYIAQDKPNVSPRVGERIKSAFELLCDYPGLGREGREPGTREWVVRGLPYIVVYSAIDSDLVVLGVFHGAQKR
jgi:toxin ParE1/3/4